MVEKKNDLDGKTLLELREELRKEQEELKKLLEGKGQDLKKTKGKKKNRRVKLKKTKKAKSRDPEKTTDSKVTDSGVRMREMGTKSFDRDIATTQKGMQKKAGKSTKKSKTAVGAIGGCHPSHRATIGGDKRVMAAVNAQNLKALSWEPKTTNYHASVAINFSWIFRRYTLFGIHPEYLRYQMMGKDYLMSPTALFYRTLTELIHNGVQLAPDIAKEIVEGVKTYYGEKWANWVKQYNISAEVLGNYGQVQIREGNFWDYRRVNRGAYANAHEGWNTNLMAYTTVGEAMHETLYVMNSSGDGKEQTLSAGLMEKSWKGKWDVVYADPVSGKPGLIPGQKNHVKREECMFFGTYGTNRSPKGMRDAWYNGAIPGKKLQQTKPNGIICTYGISQFNWGDFGPSEWQIGKHNPLMVASPSKYAQGARQAKIDWIKHSIWVGHAMGSTSSSVYTANKDDGKTKTGGAHQQLRGFHNKARSVKCGGDTGIYQYDQRRWLARNLAVWETIHEYMESHYGEVVVSCSGAGGWQPNHGGGCYGKDGFGRMSTHMRGNASDFHVKVIKNTRKKPLYPHTVIARMQHTKIGNKTEWERLGTGHQQRILGKTEEGGMVHPWITICAVMKLIRGGLLPNMAVGHYLKIYQGSPSHGTGRAYDWWIPYNRINDGVLRTSDKPHLDTMNKKGTKPFAGQFYAAFEKIRKKNPDWSGSTKMVKAWQAVKSYEKQGTGSRTDKWVWLAHYGEAKKGEDIGKKEIGRWSTHGGSRSWINTNWYKDNMINSDGYVFIRGGIHNFDDYKTPKTILDETGIKNHWLFHLEEDLDTSISQHLEMYKNRYRERKSVIQQFLAKVGTERRSKKLSGIYSYTDERAGADITDFSAFDTIFRGVGYMPSFWNFYMNLPFWTGADQAHVPPQKYSSKYGGTGLYPGALGF